MRSEPVNSPTISQDIEQMCVNIVKHVQNISSGNTQIYQMDLIFKLDYDNRLWLMMCTDLKIREKFKLESHNKEVLKKKKLGKKETEREMSPTFKFLENPDMEDKNAIVSSLKMNRGIMKQYIGNKNTISKHARSKSKSKIKLTRNKKPVLNQEQSIRKHKQNIGYCSRCLIQSNLYPVKMAHICSWKKNNPKDKELKMLVKRIWGEEYLKDEFKLENLMEEKSWLQTYTMFCDECYLTCVHTFMMSKEEKDGLLYTQDVTRKIEEKKKQIKRHREEMDLQLYMTKSSARTK